MSKISQSKGNIFKRFGISDNYSANQKKETVCQLIEQQNQLQQLVDNGVDMCSFYLLLLCSDSDIDDLYYKTMSRKPEKDMLLFDKTKNILENLVNLTKPKRHSKQRIPKEVKNHVWIRYCGSHTMETKCYCCGINEINTLSGFEVGHIIAEACGGTTNITNLRPICHKCNLSMGMENMYEYAQKHYTTTSILLQEKSQ